TRFVTRWVLIFFVGAGVAWAEDQKKNGLPGDEFVRLLTLVQTGKTPSIYGSVCYPRWAKPMDGLKSVAVEGIAEHANREAKRKGLKLELVGKPVVDGEVAGVLLRRSGGGIKAGVFPAYLFRDEKNGWGFLGFPIPYKRPAIPGFPRDRDDEFLEDALNDPTPYDGVLYEFDAATRKQFEAVTAKLETAIRAMKGKGGRAAGREGRNK
ncbi:MAG: hypothetical protein PVJ98_02660, partial [Akkermansiaceae bacterium]